MADKSQRDMKKRVVISGLGMVTPLGVGKEEFYQRLFGGENGISEIKSFDTNDFTSHLARK